MKLLLLKMVIISLLYSPLLSLDWEKATYKYPNEEPIYQFQSFHNNIYFCSNAIFIINNNYESQRLNLESSFLNKGRYNAIEVINNRIIVDANEIVILSDSVADNWVMIAKREGILNGIDKYAYTNTGILYAITWSESILKSTDKGYNWSDIDIPSSSSDISINKYNGFIYSWWGSHIFLSTDTGDSWIALESELPRMPLVTRYTDIFFHQDGSLYWGYFNHTVHKDSFGLYKSDMYGKNVEFVYKPSKTFNDDAKIYFKHNLGFICSDSLFAVSEDYGKNWTEYPTPVPKGDKLTSIFFSDDNYFYVGTYYGEVLRAKFEPNSVSDIYNNIDISIVPNPANEYIDIKYHTVETGLRPVSTKICNVIGEIANIPPENPLLPENGVKRVDVSHLPNGIYFATIKSGTEIITKQFVIMR